MTLTSQNLDHFQALTCICESPLSEAELIVSRVVDKENRHCTLLEGSNIDSETEKDLCELGTKQVSNTFRPALAIHTFTLRYQHVRKAFRITFKTNLFPVGYLNASSYIQLVFGVVRKEGLLYVTDVPRVFEVLVWLLCLKLVHTEVN